MGVCHGQGTDCRSACGASTDSAGGAVRADCQHPTPRGGEGWVLVTQTPCPYLALAFVLKT